MTETRSCVPAWGCRAVRFLPGADRPRDPGRRTDPDWGPANRMVPLGSWPLPGETLGAVGQGSGELRQLIAMLGRGYRGDAARPLDVVDAAEISDTVLGGYHFHVAPWRRHDLDPWDDRGRPA